MSVVCRRLAGESRTGCLYLLADADETDREVRIYLREGKIYTAAAPGQRARLGDRLVGGGHLTAEDRDRALQLQASDSPDERLGDLLVSEGMVDREVLRQVIREQISDSIAVALARSKGEWRFVPEEAVPEDVPLGLGMQDTLMEAARRLGQLEVIRARLGGLDAVVDFGAGSKEMRLALKPDEWAMLTHIDGYNSVKEIAEMAGYGELEAARIIYGLLSAGVVHVVGDGASGLPAAPMTLGDASAAPVEASTYERLRSELESLGDLSSGPSTAPAGPPPPLPTRTPPGQPAAAQPPPPPQPPPAPAPEPTPAPAPPEPTPESPQRSLSDGAGLFADLHDEGPPAPPAPTPPPPETQPTPEESPKDQPERGGLFGRFRKR